MPNWCSNNGYIKLPRDASPEAREAFKKLAENKAEAGWFANVLPCPPEMNLGCGSTVARAEYANLSWLKANSKFTGDFGTFETLHYKDGGSSTEFTPSEAYLQYLQDTFGAIDWYEWNIVNYGTKWDVEVELSEPYNDRIDVNQAEADACEDTIDFTFGSAWSPPLEFFRWLANEYGIHYMLRYSEPGCCFGGISSFDGILREKHAEGDAYLLLRILDFNEPIQHVIDLESYDSFEEYRDAHPRLEAKGGQNPILLRTCLHTLVKKYYNDRS